MSINQLHHTYTIKEAAALTGLPASTLRYYESIGIIAPVDRGQSSKHRLYTDADLDHVLGVACLAAIGLSASDMKQYVANSELGSRGASGQIELLSAQFERLKLEAEFVALRQRYVELKVNYWRAVEAGDNERVVQLLTEGRAMAQDVKKAKHH